MVTAAMKLKDACSLEEKLHSGDFPGGPVAETLQLLMLGAWVQFLVRELDPRCCNEEVPLCQDQDLAQPSKEIE